MEFSRLFTQDESFSFFNGGTLSKVPLSVVAAAERYSREGLSNPTAASFNSFEQFGFAQGKLAPAFGMQPEDFFFRPNITTALNDFLFAVEICAGEILATGMEYGATTNIARVRAAHSGLSFRAAPLPLGPEVSAEDLLSAVVGAFSAETRLLVVSHIVTGTGVILPIREIAAEAKKRGILVVVDGAHAIGSIPLNVEELGVDFYGGNFHKWFMGPAGTAFGWVHPRWRGKIAWKFGGWASFGVPDHYRHFPWGEEAAKRLFPGTTDAAPYRALVDTVEFRAQHGEEFLRTRQNKFRDLAAAMAEAAGWERVSPRYSSLLGPLVSFRVPAHWPKLPSVDLATKIYREAAVQIALPGVQGETLVRLSPGAYATDNEVSAGMERLTRFGR